MKFISGLLEPLQKNKKPIAVIGLALSLTYQLTVSTPIYANQCKDAAIIFARGSSQNKDSVLLDNVLDRDFLSIEPESAAFFNRFNDEMNIHYPEVNTKYITVHNFPNKYNPLGYQAKGVFSWADRNNMLQAELSWWPNGQYSRSVLNGKEELVGYVKDQIAECPAQLIVMGGYSQGAQVVGEALFDFSPEERARINAVALFGDPKFVAGTAGEGLEFWRTSKPHPWKRGNASERERGLADPRLPYVPDDMAHKTLSWCFSDDFVCSGYSGFKLAINPKRTIKKNTTGHSRYKDVGIPEAVREIIQLNAPRLYAANKVNGGIDEAAGPDQTQPTTPNQTPRDIALLVNTSGEVDNTIKTLRYATDDVMLPISSLFPATRYGVADFSELIQQQTYIPRLNIRQGLTPYQNDNLTHTMVNKLSWGGLGGGGADVPDPHALALEKTIQNMSWDDKATKHIVLITDRPAKDTQTYNICNGSVQSNMVAETVRPCTEAQTYDTVYTNQASLYCTNVTIVMSQQRCRLKKSQPYYLNMISRSLNDAIMLAGSKGIAVSVVVHQTMDRPDIDNEAAKQQLRSIAERTGGLYFEYDKFDQAQYSDVMWKVTTHKPKRLRMTTYDNTRFLEGKSAVSTASKSYVPAKINVPTILDVSSNSNDTYDSYRWDFNSDGEWDKETSTPTVEYVFDSGNNRDVLTVAAIENDAVVATLVLPVKVLPYEGPAAETIQQPSFTPSITTQRTAEGLIVHWQVTDEYAPGVVFIGDQSGLPVKSAPYHNGQMTLKSNTVEKGGELMIWYVQDGVSSEKHIFTAN